jgi:hypothetical protein
MKSSTNNVNHRRDVIKGHLFDAQLDRPNIVRIFLSSTFHGKINLNKHEKCLDFVHERNHLFNNAFPELDKWCVERGLEFQVSDMRWGIRDSMSSEHGTTEMCLQEIRHCQELSVGPNFVVSNLTLPHNSRACRHLSATDTAIVQCRH